MGCGGSVCCERGNDPSSLCKAAQGLSGLIEKRFDVFSSGIQDLATAGIFKTFVPLNLSHLFG